MPNTLAEVQNTGNISDISKSSFDRIRLAYDKVDEITNLSYSYGNTEVTFSKQSATTNPDGNAVTMTVYDTQKAWEAASADGTKTVGANELVFIKDAGDLVVGSSISNDLKSNKAAFTIDYQKTGFDKGELRPEYYYNCTDVSDAANPIKYTKYNADGSKIYEDINYTVALNQTIKVNMQADEVFDMSIYQDVVELTDSVQAAINAHDKVDKLTAMKSEAQYADYQDEIQEWLDAAQKEADYADSRLTSLYSAGIGKFDQYMEKLNVAYTEVGARGDQLKMTESRMSNQQLTVEQLKSDNEDRDISDIIIDYTAAYNAYQASLLASSKIEKQTLLNYI